MLLRGLRRPGRDAQALARNPDAANEIFYEFNAVGYAIHSWQLGPLRILLQNGSTLSKEDQQHILRISSNNQELLDELVAIQDKSDTSMLHRKAASADATDTRTRALCYYWSRGKSAPRRLSLVNRRAVSRGRRAR